MKITKQIATEHTLAFGDNYNDVEMLHTAGRGILMGNAPEDTKDNDHDGIAVYLHSIFPF